MHQRCQFALLLLCILGLTHLLWAADPFAGTWELNVARSKASGPGLVHQSETIKIISQENGSTYIFDGVDAGGRTFHGMWSGNYDGKYYPFTGNPDADMKSAKIISATALEFSYTKDGKEVATWRFTISEEGKTITAVGKGRNSKGQDYMKDLVFDRR